MARRRKLILTLVFFFGAAFCAHADQFNDLYYIDPGGVPDLTEEGKQNEQGGSGGGSIGSGSSSSGSGGSAGGGSSEGGSGSSTGNDTHTGGGNEEEASSEQTEEEEEQAALESLLEVGAISGELGGVTSGVFSGGGGSIIVNGSRVRTFLRKDPDIDEVLRYWKIGKGKKRPEGKTSKDRLTPGEYYALVAATLAAEDEGLQEVRFTAQDFTVTYRSRGALFAFIPWSFPVRVFVAPRAPTERVTVRFPWYHWFVREYFTRADLAQEVEAILAAMAQEADIGEDIQAELCNAVTHLLRQKVRTITESILLR